jgi:hypothetical protein
LGIVMIGISGVLLLAAVVVTVSCFARRWKRRYEEVSYYEMESEPALAQPEPSPPPQPETAVVAATMKEDDEDDEDDAVSAMDLVTVPLDNPKT